MKIRQVLALGMAGALWWVGWGQTTEQSSILVTISPNRQVFGVGETVTCQFSVQNTGDLRIENLLLNDNYGASITLAKTILDPGETATGSRTYTLTLADLPGPFPVDVTAQGKDKYNRSVVANAYTHIPTAAVALAKEANPTQAEVGATITYTFTIRNTGSTSLVLDQISDDKLGTIPLQDAALAVGASQGVTRTHALPDDPSGRVVNTAVVYGTAQVAGDSAAVTASATATVRLMRPSIHLDKTADRPSARLGETITYRYTVTNDGTFALSGLALSDDKLGAITLGKTALDPDETTEGTATYTVTEADLPGPVANIAVVRGTYTGTSGPREIGAQDDASVRVVPPGMERITLEKTVAPDQAFPGETVEFTITVTNGDTARRTFRLSDPLLGIERELTLAGGQTWTESFTYTIPEGAPNPVINVVTLRPKNGTGELIAEVRVRVVYLGTNPGRPNPRQPWDVSFAQVKLFDTQVLDGAECRLRILDGNYQPVTEIPMSGTLYVEVEDPDQNEDPRLRELIFGAWNRDSSSADNTLSDPRSEHSYPIWPQSRTETTDDRLTPGARMLAAASISGVVPTAKIFLWNAQNGSWEMLSLRETAVGSGVFRSTTCIPVSGTGTLSSSPGDTIIAFYQDPSNHSDIAIATVKVAEGGAGGVPPTPGITVAFDRTTYYPGAPLMVTVTDPLYATLPEIRGAGILALIDAQGRTIKTWDVIATVAGETARFRVTWTLPSDVLLGTLRAVYTDPGDARRTGQAAAQVVAVGPDKVTGIAITPNPFSIQTTFSLISEPVAASAGRIRVSVYDLTGRRVGEILGTDTASVSWDGANLRNGAYIYVARVETTIPQARAWEFKGFVYIQR
ncbi:MAG: hypothetical protein BIP78_0430 [Candidatus Bipolaricaulis sibiricus]|uniref:DUF7507 domain-containing protein n=1 Tax=Bipolaricaulis sibiricus TaxID=2501609 RepID=A0A410FT46_BIPS1|nr:MAG: hypothetical protein BIP78_0430 [Candidatus Bipolaricaulis sibiricus]